MSSSARFPAGTRRAFRHIHSIILILLVAVAAPVLYAGGAQVEETQLTILGESLSQDFLDSDGTTLLFGMDGSAGTHRRVGGFWQIGQQFAIEAADLSDRDEPESGSVDDDVIALGLPDEGTGGEVYIFIRTAGVWEQTQILTSNAATPMRFGAAVAVDGDRLAVGDPDATDDGEIYVFERAGNTFSQVQVLTSTDNRALDLGASLELEGDLLVAGDPGYTADAAGQIGSIFVFREIGGSFVFEQRLFLQHSENLGGDVALDGSTIAGVGTGSWLPAAVFEESGGSWSATAQISSAFGDDPEWVDLSGDTMVFGDVNDAYISRRQGGSWSSREDFVSSLGFFLNSEQVIASRAFSIWESDGLDWRLVQSLEKFERRSGGFPGTSMAADGRWWAVGQPGPVGNPGPGTFSRGRVQIFERFQDAWRPIQGIEDGSSKRYGVSLDMEGERLIVGGDQLGNGALGGAGVFEWMDGSFSNRGLPEPAGLEDFDLYGISVGISGDWAAVGARGDDDQGDSAGTVYLFERIAGTWTEAGQLFASDAAAGDFFGFALALDGDTLAVGARGDDDNGSESGAVYLFERQIALAAGVSWVETQKLTPTGAAAGDAFGVSLALEGDRLLVGANQGEATMTQPGAAFVYDRSGGPFTETQKLVASDGAGSDSFGRSVALNGDRLAVGAPDAGGDVGKAYVFDFNGAIWQETAFFQASDGAAPERFGSAVAVTDFSVAVGAPGDYWNEVYDYQVFDLAAARDLQVTLTDSVDPAIPGVSFTYDASVTNASAEAATAVTLELGTTPGLELLSTSGCAEDPAGLPLCTLGTLAASATAMVTITARADPSLMAETQLTALATRTVPDAAPGDEIAVETTQMAPEADLRVTFEGTPAPAHAGAFLTLTATVENAGPAVARNVEIDAVLPPELEFFSQIGCQGGEGFSQSTCQIGGLEPGETLQISLDTMIDSGAVGPLIADAMTSTPTPEALPGDEDDSATILLASTPFLTFVESQVQGTGGVDGLSGASHLVISPTGRHVYAASPVDDEIAIFERQAGSCNLSYLGVQAAAGGAMTISPNGRLLVISDTDGLLVFERAADGLLSLLDEERNGVGGVTNLDDVGGHAFAPGGQQLYATAAGGTGAIVAFNVDETGLDFLFVETPAFFDGASDAVAAPDGSRIFATAPDGQAVVGIVRQDDGTLDQEIYNRPLNEPSALDLSPDGLTLVATEPMSSSVVLISLSDTSLEQLFESRVLDGVGGSSGLGGASDVAFDSTGRYYVASAPSDDAVGVFLVEPKVPETTRQMSFVEEQADGLGGVTDLQGPSAVAVAAGTSCVYATASISNSLVVFELAVEAAEFPPLFADGFESGNLSAWSEFVTP